MTDEKNLETYLYISPSKYGIYVIDKTNFSNLYQKETNIVDENLNEEILTQFLDDHIFKIEKSIGSFIKNIFLIIENNQVLNLNIGVKKKNYDKTINPNNLKNILIEIKNLFKKNYPDQKIMHMIINKYFTSDNQNSIQDDDLNTNDLCMIINFVSIQNVLLNHIEKLLQRYQIKIKKYVHAGYVQEFFKGENMEFPIMICKILNGINTKEIKLVPKNQENKGFFVKFFQLFS